MDIFITRPKRDAELTANALRQRGHTPFIVPLLTIIFNEKILLDAHTFQAMLVTSANGVRAFALNSKERDIPVLTVGPASATEAKALGFHNVQEAKGNVASLAALTTQRCSPEKGPLLHMAARQQAGDLKAMCEAKGFSVERLIAYEAQAASRLPTLLRHALEKSLPNSENKKPANQQGLVFFSRRTAETFANLAHKAGLIAACHHFTAFCLSQAVAEPLQDIHFGGVHIAPQNTQTALLDLIELE